MPDELVLTIKKGSRPLMLARTDKKGSRSARSGARPGNVIGARGSAKRGVQACADSGRTDLGFREIADVVPGLLWTSSPNGYFTYLNDEWTRFTQCPKERCLGMGWMKRIHPKDSDMFRRAYSQALEQKNSFSAIVRLAGHDNRYRWFLFRGVPCTLTDGSFAGLAGCGLDVTEEKALADTPLELSGRLIQAQEAERSRIARELHDDISQRLALVTNGIQEIEQPRTRVTQAHQRNQLREIRKLATEIGADVQFLSHQLHPSKLQYLGLTAAIRSLCREMSARHRLDVSCTVRCVPEKLSENVSLSLFRTAQESLQNVVKHSRARHATVELIGQPDLIRLRVSDDGIGFDPTLRDTSHGLGLVSMRERLNLVGGNLLVSSRPKAGTRIEGVVPVHPQATGNSLGRSPH